MRVYGAGIRNVNILYRAGRDNTNADALSRQPHLSATTVGTADDDVQVLSIGTGDELDISSLLMLEAESTDRENNSTEKENNLYQEQRKDAEIMALIDYLEKRTLSKSTMDAR